MRIFAAILKIFMYAFRQSSDHTWKFVPDMKKGTGLGDNNPL